MISPKSLIPVFLLLFLHASAAHGESREGTGGLAGSTMTARPVRMVNTPYPPFAVGGYGPAQGGISVEIVRELFGRLGRTVEVELHPWKRALKMAETGRADGITLLARSSERERYLIFTEPLFDIRELFYYNSERLPGFEWDDFGDLKPYTIGMTEAYAYCPEFLEAVATRGLRVEYANTNAANFKKLHSGRIDLYLGNEIMAESVIATNAAWRRVIRPAERPVRAYPDFIALSRKSPVVHLLPEINAAIITMKRDGTMKLLLGSVRPDENGKDVPPSRSR